MRTRARSAAPGPVLRIPLPPLALVKKLEARRGHAREQGLSRYLKKHMSAQGARLLAEEWYVHPRDHAQGRGDLVYRLPDGSDLVVENKFMKSMGSLGAKRSKRHSDVTAQAWRYGNCWRCRVNAAAVVRAASFTPDRGLVVHKVWHRGMDSLCRSPKGAACSTVQESGAARAAQSNAVAAGGQLGAAVQSKKVAAATQAVAHVQSSALISQARPATAHPSATQVAAHDPAEPMVVDPVRSGPAFGTVPPAAQAKKAAKQKAVALKSQALKVGTLSRQAAVKVTARTAKSTEAAVARGTAASAAKGLKVKAAAAAVAKMKADSATKAAAEAQKRAMIEQVAAKQAAAAANVLARQAKAARRAAHALGIQAAAARKQAAAAARAQKEAESQAKRAAAAVKQTATAKQAGKRKVQKAAAAKVNKAASTAGAKQLLAQGPEQAAAGTASASAAVKAAAAAAVQHDADKARQLSPDAMAVVRISIKGSKAQPKLHIFWDEDGNSSPAGGCGCGQMGWLGEGGST